jgi:hypothetical protein
MNIIIDTNFQYISNDLYEKYENNELSSIDHINGLIKIISTPLSSLLNNKNKEINCYIHPNIFNILDRYTNKELEDFFINNCVNPFGSKLNSKSCFDKIHKQQQLTNIITTAITNEDFIFLDYLMSRNINLRNNNFQYILSQCISILLNNNNKFYILQKLIEYGICISTTDILYEYIYTIYRDTISYREEDEEMNEINQILNNNIDNNYQYNDKNYRIVPENFNSLDKNSHFSKIKYLSDKGASLNYYDKYDDITIIDMLTELEYINDVQWLIRRDYLMFVDGTGINIHKDNDEQEYICRYLTNDFIMIDILSYM